MFNSHEFLITCHSFQALPIIENETDNVTIDVSQSSRAISVGVGWFKLPVSTCTYWLKNISTRLGLYLSDYDLSLVCTSKCDDEYLRCSSTCSSSYCLLECHRIAVACDDCKSLWVQFYHFSSLVISYI